MQDFHEEQDLGKVYDWGLVQRLLVYARPYWKPLSGCILMVFGLAALKLAQPAIIALAIDQVMRPAATVDAAARAALVARLWPLAGLYFVTVIGAAALEYGQAYLLRVTGQSIIARIRQDLFEHLQSLSLAFFDANPVGRLVTRATNDVEALNEMYTSVLVSLFKDVFFIVGAMGLMLARDWKLSLVSFTIVPFVALSAGVFQRLARQAWRVVRVKLARVNATLSENFSGMRIVQIFAREGRQSEEFEAINQEYFKASWYQLQVYAVFRPLLEVLATASLVAVVWYGGIEAIAGTLSFGTLYAFTAYNRQLFDPINELAEKYNVLQSALAAAERIFQLLGTPPAVQDPAPRDSEAETPVVIRVAGDAALAPPPAVEFRDVWFAYQGEAWVLQGLSFRIETGQTAAFVGHTGAGKSTIMALVARFYDVQEGAVLVDGVDVRDWPQAALRRRVGTVMQDVFLFAGDVAENVSLGDPAIDRAAVERAAKAVGADRFIRALGAGYDEPVVERGLTLSSGQRQLVSFARALAYDPEVLVLDEATANIDSETEAALQAAMKEIARGRTTLIVAHRLSTIQDADRIFVMHKGRIREQGRHKELLALGGLYHRLWLLQLEGTGPLRRAEAP